jgi:hypothetical protein
MLTLYLMDSLLSQTIVICVERFDFIAYYFSSPDSATPCLPALTSYLSHLPSVSLVPVPITKAIWFIFAVSI